MTENARAVRAHTLVDQLPETADWKDVAYEVSVMQDIEEACATVTETG
ncbi:MAG: hypothetical protein ACREXX_10670 [Gammaproteobacteria bacterium]